MLYSTNSNINGFGGQDAENVEPLPVCLWISNFGNEISETDLLTLFQKHDTLGCLFIRAARSYAFVYFKRIEDATAAKDAFNEITLKSSVLTIEIAREARPNKNLWVCGISPTLTKEQLEADFSKFGKIGNIRFFRERNTAIIEYFRIQDSSQALKIMNGKRVCGDQLYVDFLRAQPLRKDRGPYFHDLKDLQFDGRNVNVIPFPWVFNGNSMNCSQNIFPGPQLQQASPFYGGNINEGQCSTVLWVGYPHSVQIDDQMLHNAMILFGEIERIRSFPSQHYSLVEFRSAEEARRAKEGLQGRLFNDPRILIVFSNGFTNEFSQTYPGSSQPNIFMGNMFTPTLPLVSFPTGNMPPGIPPSNIYAQPFDLQGGIGSFIRGPEFADWRPPLVSGVPPHFSEVGQTRHQQPNSWDVNHTNNIQREVRGTQVNSWNGNDPNLFPREAKRSRLDSASSVDSAVQNPKKMDDIGSGMNQSHRFDIQSSMSATVRPEDVKPVSYSSQGSGTLTIRGHDRASGNHFIWRGIISKGGTPVCRARCIPVGKGIESELSQVVNCSARTGLDMLSRHYAEAIGFDMVFFMPDNDDDFAPYTEFLHYLGENDRAGVAKLDDGTTLFLVPPSVFLRNVLNISGPDRLYGLVLKMPPYPLEPTTVHPSDPPRITSTSITETPSSVPFVHSIPQTVPPTSGISLTPELIATLASLLPLNTKSHEASQSVPSSNSQYSVVPSFNSQHFVDNTVIPDKSLFPAWNPPSGNSFNRQHLPPSNVTAQFVENTPKYDNTIHDRTYFSHSNSSFPIPTRTVSEAGAFSDAQGKQTAYNSQMGISGVAAGCSPRGSSAIPQYKNPTYSSDQLQVISSQIQASAKPQEPRKQVQPVHPNEYGSNHSTVVSETDEDKNQRYQSTLKFAASLLLQIQKKQQQQQQPSYAGTQAGGRSEAHH